MVFGSDLTVEGNWNSGAMLAADLESGDVAYLCKTNTLEIIK